jgi:hypothetical protein
MSPDESQRNTVARVRAKMVTITGGSTRWSTNPESGTGFVNSVHAQPLESPSSDAARSAPRSLEEALAAMEARPADAWWDYAEPTPREVPFDIEIEEEADGSYLLIYQPADGSLYGGDTWHATQDEAEEFALEQFGVQAHEWQRHL